MPTKICERQLSFVGYAGWRSRRSEPGVFRGAIRLPHSGYEHLAVSEGIEAR
jgi:hypothetical protein